MHIRSANVIYEFCIVNRLNLRKLVASLGYGSFKSGEIISTMSQDFLVFAIFRIWSNYATKLLSSLIHSCF